MTTSQQPTSLPSPTSNAEPPLTPLNSAHRIKPRFPAARIKRIMQSDNDVGKINQATPFLVSKALELFLNQLLCVSIEHAKSSPHKKLTPKHMMIAIASFDKFDFLRHITDSKVFDDDAAPESSSAASTHGD